MMLSAVVNHATREGSIRCQIKASVACNGSIHTAKDKISVDTFSFLHTKHLAAVDMTYRNVPRPCCRVGALWVECLWVECLVFLY